MFFFLSNEYTNAYAYQSISLDLCLILRLNTSLWINILDEHVLVIQILGFKCLLFVVSNLSISWEQVSLLRSCETLAQVIRCDGRWIMLHTHKTFVHTWKSIHVRWWIINLFHIIKKGRFETWMITTVIHYWPIWFKDNWYP